MVIDKRIRFERHTVLNSSHRQVAPKPEIEEATIQHVVIGQHAQIVCYVQVEVGTIFLLDWIYPDAEGGSTGRILVGNTTRHFASSNQQNVWEKTLTILNVNEKDEGNYTCQITDHSNNTNFDTKYVKVFSLDDTYINLTVHSKRIEVDATHREIARWILTLHAHPYADLNWYSPDGVKLSRETLVNDKYEMRTKGFQTILEIYDVDVTDAGNYTVIASNHKEKQMLTLELIVFDKPDVQIEVQDLYQLGAKSNVTCRVTGYPVPRIRWRFKKCDFTKNEKCWNNTYQTIPSDSVLTTELQIYNWQLESKLEWKMEEPGLLNCLATNDEGVGNDTAKIRVTDVPQGFHITEIPNEIVVGDNVTIKCGVASYNYTSNLVWYYQRDDSKAAERYGREGVVKNESRNFAHWTKLEFSKISKSDSGIYKCVAEKLGNETVKEEKIIRLNVLELEAPVIYDTNLTNSEVTISSWQPLSWRCAAKGVPEPTIVWYRNDEILPLNKNFLNFEITDDNQTLLMKSLTMNEEGTYTCRVENKGGFQEAFVSLKLKEHHKTKMTLVITVVVVAILLFILTLFFVFVLWKFRRERKELKLAGLQNFNKGMVESINQDLTLDEQTDLLPYDPKWEFPRSKLKLGKQLGSGAFGVVLKAEAYGIVEDEECTTVAVKMVKRQADSAYIRALASELKILAHLGKHLNVVNLLGACTKNIHKRELLVIVEFCTFGNVHNYLLSHRDMFIDQIDTETGEIDVTKGRMVSDYNRSRINYATLTFPPSVTSDPNSALVSFDTNTTCLSSVKSVNDEIFSTGSDNNPDWCANLKGDYLKNSIDMLSTSTLVCWAFQIARGMEYLSSRRVLHGDLAARNILLAENNVVKICDFGFAKSIYNNPEYRKSGDGPVPVKWMAIESVTHRVFSTQSDVWSFGIVLWELFSLARTPYPGFENFEIIHNKLIEGYRMEKPTYANQRLYDIMLECWDAQPCRRPSFSELVMKLGKLLENNVKEHYITLNDQYVKYSIPEGEDYLSMVSPPTYDAPKPHYVNLPNNKTSSNNGSEGSGSDYLDMSPWTATPTGGGQDCIEMKPMLSEKERHENNLNDNYLVPRTVPVNSNCAFNPNYLVSQNSGGSDRSYGKLNKIDKSQTEMSDVTGNGKFFENLKNNEQKQMRNVDEEKRRKKNHYVNA
ncbi:hypothetical protein RUM44_008074 [Polyplax serrata]|uniref:receptor protein-tyrosine kinase n=1 Tax=Polyplax serrata TaxID=468196 RepID=A0ABR1BBE6_POLSC